MPNNGRVTLCPYYRDEKNLSISCEDTFHRFRWAAQKRRHMDTFCDKDWKSCPYAQEIGAMYEKGDYMDEVKRAAFELEATKKELRKTATMLGKAQKREKEKDEKIRIIKCWRSGKFSRAILPDSFSLTSAAVQGKMSFIKLSN